MDAARLKKQLEGCYITVPTMFSDDDLSVDFTATRRSVRFWLDNGITARYGTLLAGGAAGDFSTMTFDERIQLATSLVEEANGKVPIAMGAQTTSTLELRRLAKAAQSIGAQYIQISPPYYFAHTGEDFYEYVAEAAAAADIGIIIYNTFWTSTNIAFPLVERIAEIPHVVGLKWACPRTDAMEFENVVSKFHERFTIIDNNLLFVMSHIMGARAFEVHVATYWPEWGVKLIDDLEARRYTEVQHSLVHQAMPFYNLWMEIERTYTSGDGYLNKLCMELVGLASSRCRPPTRDVRGPFLERARQMLIDTRVPRVVPK
jgi:dihydrodipicolinate synthase/N-acetylneuraminate lyase